MGSEWTRLRLGNYCDKIGSGATPRGGKDVYLSEGQFTLIRSQNVYNHGFQREGLVYISEKDALALNNVEVQTGDILINITGDSVARVCQVEPEILPARVNQHVAIIRPQPKKINTRFLRYFLVSPRMQSQLISWASAGATRNALTKSMLESIEIFLPADLFEQHAIAHILGTLDDKIELNRRMNETLEGMARALFKSWFVDFDPVRAKVEGRDTGLPSEISDLFPDEFVDSELGEIPKGWEVSTLGSVSQHSRRSIKPDEIPQGTPYIALEHMPKKSIALSSWGIADELESNKYQFNRGEILFGKLRPYFHKVGVAPLDGVCSTDIVVISPQKDLWHAFVLGHASSDVFVEHTNASSTGTRMPRTNWNDMAAFKVILPPEQLAEYLTAMTTPFIEKIIENIHESLTLSSLRDTLLPKLISGEIRVGEAEKYLEVVET